VDLDVQVYWELSIKMDLSFSILQLITPNLIKTLGIKKPMFYTWNYQLVLASVQLSMSPKKLQIKSLLKKQFKL